VQVRSYAVTLVGPLLLTSVNTRHLVTRCVMPCVVVLDVVGSNRSPASLAPVAAYSSEIQQPMRTTAILGRHQHPYWAAPLDRNQDRAGSLHPDGCPRWPALGCAAAVPTDVQVIGLTAAYRPYRCYRSVNREQLS
jgi:hypothetical protein